MQGKETDATPPRSDGELLTAIGAGDRQALAELYDRAAPRLFALAERLLRNPIDAEDLVHDLFIEVYHRATTYDAARGSVTSWLVMRLRSRAIDRLRSPGYRRLVSMQGELPTEATEPSFEAQLGGEAMSESLKQAVRELPQDTQTILNLVYFKGMSLPEVASSLVMPLGTVKSRLHRALRNLRTAVADGGGREGESA